MTFALKFSVKLVYLMSGNAWRDLSVTVTRRALLLSVLYGSGQGRGRGRRDACEGEGAGEEDGGRPARGVGGGEAGGPAEGGRVEGLEGVKPGQAAEEEHRVALKWIRLEQLLDSNLET